MTLPKIATRRIKWTLVALGAVTMTCVLLNSAVAQELRFMCSNDGNECEIYRELFDRFEAQNSGAKIVIEKVPYKAILENLPIQLAAGTGPDLARVTDFGGLNQYYLDLSPYIDTDYWNANFGTVQPWYRKDHEDTGIYGLHSQMTVTGPFINLTLFEQANVPVPDPDSDWDTWAAAAKKVAKATGVTFPMAIDRSGHRIAGPAISFGAELFDENGNFVLFGDAFSAFVEKFVAWHEDDTMAREIWGSGGGTTYQDAKTEFVSGELVFYYSGSWQVQGIDESVGNGFDWQVVGSPCGVGGCSGMPGGTGVVGFKQSKHSELVAKLLDFLAQKDNYRYYSSQTLSIPAHAGVAAQPIDYPTASKTASDALNAFAAQVPDLSPIAVQYQGYTQNRALFNISLQRVTQAVVGELTVAEAMARANKDFNAVLKATAKKHVSDDEKAKP